MPNPETAALRAYRKEMARMISEFRQFVYGPHILIGRAAILLFNLGEPVTKEAIRELLTVIDDPLDADLARRASELLDQPESGI